MLDLQTIELAELRNSPGGIHCRYMDAGNGTGLKCYLERRIRDSQFANQTLLNEQGLAPECWEPVEFGQFFGFYTEAAEVFNMDYYNGLGGYNTNRGKAYRQVWDALAHRMSDKLREYGFNPDDCHYQNVGFLPNNDLVLIDCDLMQGDGLTNIGFSHELYW